MFTVTVLPVNLTLSFVREDTARDYAQAMVRRFGYLAVEMGGPN